MALLEQVVAIEAMVSLEEIYQSWAGAKKEATDRDDWTPLHHAAINGQEAAVKLQLGKGEVDVDRKDSRYGRTPLSWAAANGHEAIVKLLLVTGKVNVDTKDNYSRTPLLWAARNENGHEAIVKLLLDTGKVDVDRRDFSGLTPLSRAVAGGHEAVVQLLERVK
jgi:ankyrin repeat protein